MKREEIIKQITDYKHDINRILTNKGLLGHVGFTLVNGKSFELYTYHAKNRNILNPSLYVAKSAIDLLNAIKIVHSSAKFLA